MNNIKYLNFNLYTLLSMSFPLTEEITDCHIAVFLQLKQLLSFKGLYDTCYNLIIILPASLK